MYIKKNELLLRELSTKMYLEKELQYLEELIKTLKTGRKLEENASFSSIRSELPPEILPYLSPNPETRISAKPESPSEKQLADWDKIPSNANSYRISEKRHRTSDGNYVRSKSELIIYEKLLQYGIRFKYEAPLIIGNTTFYPDFTILLPDGQIIYWEHAGMMQNEDYRLNHKRKMNIYESAGIFPWKNLIVTYDDENGNLDIRIVESEIKNRLLG